MSMNEPTVDNAVVVYGVKDLLAEIRDDVKNLGHKLDTKVDKADFNALELRMDQRFLGMEARLKPLEIGWARVAGAMAAMAALGGVGGASLVKVFG